MNDLPFDPYADWLGIRPDQRPIDHYRLLGLPLFENDSQRIELAADQRMALVRSFQTGQRAAWSQRLLNELAAAKLCLLSPESKATYDAVLRDHQRLARQTTPPPFAAPAPVVPPPAPAPVPPPPPLPRSTSLVTTVPAEDPRPESPTSRRLIGAVLVLGVVMLAVGGTLVWFRPPPPRPTLPQQLDSPRDAESLAGDSAATGPAEKNTPSAGREESVVVAQEANGEVHLTASTAQVHGPGPTLALAGDDSVLSGWTSAEEWLSWDFRLAQADVFEVHFRYGARGEGTRGQWTFVVGDETRTLDITGTGDPQVFRTDRLFLAVRRKGKNTLELRAQFAAADDSVTVQEVRLVPRGIGRQR